MNFGMLATRGAKMFQRGINSYASKELNIMGSKIMGGRLMRYGAAAGLGAFALKKGSDTVDSLRDHRFGSALLGGAMAAAGGYAAYKTLLPSTALRGLFNQNMNKLRAGITMSRAGMRGATEAGGFIQAGAMDRSHALGYIGGAIGNRHPGAGSLLPRMAGRSNMPRMSGGQFLLDL